MVWYGMVGSGTDRQTERAGLLSHFRTERSPMVCSREAGEKQIDSSCRDKTVPSGRPPAALRRWDVT